MRPVLLRGLCRHGAHCRAGTGTEVVAVRTVRRPDGPPGTARQGRAGVEVRVSYGPVACGRAWEKHGVLPARDSTDLLARVTPPGSPVAPTKGRSSSPPPPPLSLHDDPGFWGK
mmetsp:Transcript_20847/g.32253  ORF Transcript_20847/g.32253 Transcript_20847/m.32253 type:complete len:114 (-) Transcript_20847:58-399(-)